MATAAHDLTRLTLPTRIRAKKAGPDGLSARLELDNIASRPLLQIFKGVTELTPEATSADNISRV